jgi:L-asparaginase/Glu-tRNA(Gln) amidotransferase subunit D
MKRILLLTTGDTIAQRPTRSSVATGVELLSLVYPPTRAAADGPMRAAADGDAPAVPVGPVSVPHRTTARVDFRVVAEDVLAEPSWDMPVGTMLALARRIQQALGDQGFDGVVVAQGLESIEESALLADLLVHARGGIVFTGARRYLDDPHTDGPANLRAALDVAADPRFANVGALVCVDGSVCPARHYPQHDPNPAGANPAGANPAGANPAGANPAGANPAGANSAGPESGPDSAGTKPGPNTAGADADAGPAGADSGTDLVGAVFGVDPAGTYLGPEPGPEPAGSILGVPAPTSPYTTLNTERTSPPTKFREPNPNPCERAVRTIWGDLPERWPAFKGEPETDVALIRTYPGMPESVVTSAVDAGARGVVLEGSANGSVPVELFTAISELTSWDIPVVVPVTSSDESVGPMLVAKVGAVLARGFTGRQARIALMVALGGGGVTAVREWFGG